MPEKQSRLFSWLNTWRPDECRGQLREIYIAAASGDAMQALDAVDCIRGRGLQGDRYASGCGHWIATDGCEVTLITREELAYAQRFGAGQWPLGWHRRNLVVDGIPVAAMRRHRLRIGEVEFAFHRLRPPCAYLDRLVAPGCAAKALGKGGGVGLRVCRDGRIRCGDRVELIIDGANGAR